MFDNRNTMIEHKGVLQVASKVLSNNPAGGLVDEE
jgi:hypothetical protein